MMKAKKYDWKDSNMALFGSDTEKKVKKESAESEPAWQGAGSEEGTKIWRINKFKVEDWPQDQYGEFYNGDSYIILNTYKNADSEELEYDVHFWIGKYSTQDEYGTAAYKTVELDTFLDDKPIQHREVQGHESTKFKSYFDTIKLLKGGADTGFKRVLPEAYEPRLFHVQKTSSRKILCTQISMKRGNLTSDDVFIIDNGLTIYQYNGSRCSADEKFKAAAEVDKLQSQRPKAKEEKLEERDTSPNHPVFKLLKDGASKTKEAEKKGEKAMFKVTDADGSLDMELLLEGSLDRSLLTSDDVYIINTGDHVFCWVGGGASIDERRNGLSYACNYVNKTETPYLPVTVESEGKESEDFKSW